MQDPEYRGLDDDSSGDEDNDSDDKDLPGLKNGYKKTVAMMKMIAILSVKAQECDNKNVIKSQEYSQ